MFGDQTPSNIVLWPNMLMLKWVAKRLKHVWSNTDQTIDTSRWASVVRMPASNMFDTRLSTRTKDRPSNTAFKFYQTRPNTINHIQTRSNSTRQGVQTVKCLFDKCLATKHRQTLFGGQTFYRLDTLSGAVWSRLVVLGRVWSCLVVFDKIRRPSNIRSKT